MPHAPPLLNEPLYMQIKHVHVSLCYCICGSACVTCVFSPDIRKLYYQAGVENKPTVFLFNDTQVVEESFLEDINNILSSGEVPNLYKPEEFEEVHVHVCTCVHVPINCADLI